MELQQLLGTGICEKESAACSVYLGFLDIFIPVATGRKCVEMNTSPSKTQMSLETQTWGFGWDALG